MVGILVAEEESLEEMNRITKDWMTRAAKGECSWICPDCSCTFSDGMPDECAHDHQKCTDILQRDKARVKGI